MSRGHHGAALARSKSIDQQIDEEREKREKEIQLLILGGASCGKSTFIKQIRIHQGDGFPDEERAKLRHHVYENVADGLNVVLDHMPLVGAQFETEEAKNCASELQKLFPRYNHYYIASGSTSSAQAYDSTFIPISPAHRDRLPPPNYGLLFDHLDAVMKVWKDSGVQRCYEQKKKFSQKLVHAEDYFLQHLPKIAEKSYIPSIQDILIIRKPTVGVNEHTFHVNGLDFRLNETGDEDYTADGKFTSRVVDVAGQRSQRKKWIHFFENVTAVIFFAALSGYCETLEEDRSMNALQDSLNAFSDVAKNSFLDKTDFILFLNKKDVFEEMLPEHSLKVCFPDYTGADVPEEGTKYIKEQFMKKKPESKQAYFHVSCAIDVQMMKKVIMDVMQIIIEINLRKAAPF